MITVTTQPGLNLASMEYGGHTEPRHLPVGGFGGLGGDPGGALGARPREARPGFCHGDQDARPGTFAGPQTPFCPARISAPLEALRGGCTVSGCFVLRREAPRDGATTPHGVEGVLSRYAKHLRRSAHQATSHRTLIHPTSNQTLIRVPGSKCIVAARAELPGGQKDGTQVINT